MTQRISGAMALLFAFGACTTVAQVPSTLPVATGPEPTTSAAARPSLARIPPLSCVQKVFSALTEQQRIGQLFMLGLASDRLGADQKTAIRANGFGSVWFTEKSSLGTRRIRMITDSIQRLAQSRVTGGIRFFVAANQEG